MANNITDFCSPVVGPSGESIIFNFPSALTDVSDGNEVQGITLVGKPSSPDGTFAISCAGQNAVHIPTIPSPPVHYSEWNWTLANTGSFDLFVNFSNSPSYANASANVLYQVFDGPTFLGEITLNQRGDTGQSGGPVNPTTTPDPDGLRRNDGVPLAWYGLGRFTFSTTQVTVRVSCPAVAEADWFAVDNLRIANAGVTVARIPVSSSVSIQDAIDNGTKFFQVSGQTTPAIRMRGDGAGTRYLVNPAVVQSALESIPLIGRNNILVSGDGLPGQPSSNLRIKFVGKLAGLPQPLLTSSDPEHVVVSELVAGGVLPQISINGNPKIRLLHDWGFWYATTKSMPFISFNLPQTPNLSPYQGIKEFENFTTNGPGARWSDGIGGGYKAPAGRFGQAQAVFGSGATATWLHRPLGPGDYRVSATWPKDSAFAPSASFTVMTTPYAVLLPTPSSGTVALNIVEGIRPISKPCKLAVTVGNASSQILATSATLHGLDASGNPVSEKLPAFTANPGSGSCTVVSDTVFSLLSSVDFPAQGGNGVNLQIDSVSVLLGTYPINQTVAPSGDIDLGIPWQVLDTFTLTGLNDGLQVILSSDGVGRLVADALKFERLTPDTSIRIKPGDVVTCSWGQKWATCVDGVVDAASDVVVSNQSGGQFYPPLPAKVEMGVGVNLNDARSSCGSYMYQNICHHADGLGGDGSVIGPFPYNQMNVGIASFPSPTYGQEGKNLASIPPGDYILMWDGVSDAQWPSGNGIVTETGTPVRTMGADNKRFYTVTGDATNYGAGIGISIYPTGVASTGTPTTYNYDFRNPRIYPANVNLANPEKYRPDFIARIAGLKNCRPQTGASGGNAVTFADFNQPQTVLSRGRNVRTVAFDVAKVEQYTGTEFKFDPARGITFLVTSSTHTNSDGTTGNGHGLSHGQLITDFNLTGSPPAILDDGSTWPIMAYILFVFRIDDNRFVFQQGPSNRKMTNVLVDPTPGGRFHMEVTTSQPLQDMIEICNEANVDLHLNLPVTLNDDCLDQIGEYCAKNLKEGLKLRVAYSNETWNSFGFPNGWCKANSYILGLGTSTEFIPFTIHESIRYWNRVKAAWVAAGRKAEDFIKLLEGFHVMSDLTRQYGQACHEQGVVPDEFATAPYLTNRPSGCIPNVAEYRFGPLIDRMTVGQHLDILEWNFVYGGYEQEFTAHINQIQGKNADGSGTALYPEMASVKFITYEGGPENMAVPGGSNVNGALIRHAIVRHPRWYGIYQHILRIYQNSGLTLFTDYAVSGFDYYDGSWPAYSDTAQLPYTPGDSAQDKIQIQTPWCVDLVKSVTGGALKAFAALYNAVVKPVQKPRRLNLPWR